MNTNTARNIAKIAQANPFTHGTGLKAFSIGQQQFGLTIQPFIQLDHYFMTQPTFSEHPHQGIAAVTYMFEDSEGTFFNKDSQGDESYIVLAIYIGRKLALASDIMKHRSNQVKSVTVFKCLSI
jgi:redox-sensitive bicupin YhaK (pirin superfamily)